MWENVSTLSYLGTYNDFTKQISSYLIGTTKTKINVTTATANSVPENNAGILVNAAEHGYSWQECYLYDASRSINDLLIMIKHLKFGIK